MIKQPFIWNFMFEVPEASVPAVEMCWDNSEAGIKGEFEELLGSLEGNSGFGQGDYFLVGKDFQSYIECQDEVDEAYRNQEGWTESSILSTATSGKFNSDRTIDQYAKEIWDIKPCVVP
jgi:starch phosphorylase